jgi:predicted amidohydrolase YtcJ
MSLLFRDVEVRGSRVDVRVQDGLISAVGPSLSAGSSSVVDGGGGALLPGLHDHHLHLLSLAASLHSVDCSTGLAGLAAAPGTGWVRGVGYHESVAGPLDRHLLDRLVPDRPVRVQHRSGSLWVLNSAALAQVRLDDSADVERADGEPNGRLWRYDDRLRPQLPAERPDLAGVVRQLHQFGITGVTDATPDLDDSAIALLTADVAPHIDLTLLGAPLSAGVRVGPAKLLLRDHDLPTYDELARLVSRHHDAGRAVAVHCVTRESLLLTLGVLREVGPLHGDRIEHAAVVPPGIAAELAALSLAVVTQPGFLRLRGDDYLRDVAPEDVPCLYPYSSLVAAGVRVAASSDAPYGDLDPWATIRNAATRRSASGVVLGSSEAVTTAVALAGYLSPPDDPGGPARAVVVGAPADLCLLRVGLSQALNDPSARHVHLVTVQGERPDLSS